MNNQLIEIILTMVQNWKWILFGFMSYKILKFGLQTYLQIMTIKFTNKDSFSVRIDGESKEISVSTSQRIKIDEIERALSSQNSNLVEIDFMKGKAS
jgi:hypothetical protein